MTITLPGLVVVQHQNQETFHQHFVAGFARQIPAHTKTKKAFSIFLPDRRAESGSAQHNPTKDAMAATDALSALDAAVCILAITEFIAELLAISQVSENVPGRLPSSSLDGNDGNAILETLEKLRIALSKNAIQIPFTTHQPSTSALTAFQRSNNSLASALRGLVSSQHVSALLLEGVVVALWPSPHEPRSQPWGPDTKAWLRSCLRSTHDAGKLEPLSCAVTRQVSTILM